MPVPEGIITSTQIWKGEDVTEIPTVEEEAEEFTLDEEVIEE